jgi:hypothetical protein
MSTACARASESAAVEPGVGRGGCGVGVGLERATAVSTACDGESTSTACMGERERARVPPLSPASGAVDAVRASVASESAAVESGGECGEHDVEGTVQTNGRDSGEGRAWPLEKKRCGRRSDRDVEESVGRV